MKKITIFSMMMLSVIWMLSGCNNKNESKEEQHTDETIQQQDKEHTVEGKDTDGKEDGVSSLLKKIEDADDYLNLDLGETGSFVTTLGTYDMTVTKAEVTDYTYEGIDSELDCWVILDITIKNTSEDTQDVEDLMDAMELSESEEGSGYIDASGAFDSVTAFEGEIAPGEEQSAQFIAYAYDSDTYYFRKASGNIAGGSSNQVMWKIDKKDMSQ